MAVNDVEIRSTPQAAGATGGCGCGCSGEDATPELDVRGIPHALRHATVFGALGVIAPGFAMDLVAPHDPRPLLNQIEQREPGAFTISYLEEGPAAWRIRLNRR